MSMHSTDNMLVQAERHCAQQGVRLTQKRKTILEILIDTDAPKSAYEIADLYRQRTDDSMPVMSVYRMLDFLMQHSLVHKLSSTNKFLACSHIACEHTHQTPQFLICDHCQQVSEIGVDTQLITALQQSIVDKQFKLNSPQLELHGLCQHCQSI